jgi:hypothetical protein
MVYEKKTNFREIADEFFGVTGELNKSVSDRSISDVGEREEGGWTYGDVGCQYHCWHFGLLVGGELIFRCAVM